MRCQPTNALVVADLDQKQTKQIKTREMEKEKITQPMSSAMN